MKNLTFRISSENKLKLQMMIFICCYWVVVIRLSIVQNFFGFYSFSPETLTPKAFVILRHSLIAATGAGVAMGLLTGLIEMYLIPKKVLHYKFVVIFTIKMCSYLVSILLISVLTILVYQLYTDHSFPDFIAASITMLKSRGFSAFLYSGFLMSIGINLFLFIHNRIGFGNFIPTITGRYTIPKEEDRIFLFIDLQSSSFMAENLGHQKYSILLQRCFRDLDDLIPQYNGTVYQFVGDEAVITWKSKNKNNFQNAISLFLNFQKKLEDKSYDYYSRFGVMPHVKGAINSGKVMVAEIGGTMKKEVAYHGDVLNSASRIMEHCKPLDYDLLISGNVQKNLDNNNQNYSVKNIGSIALRGKNIMQQVFGIIPAVS